MDANLKPSFTGPASQPIEGVLEIPRTRHDLIEFGSEAGTVRWRGEKALRQYRVEESGVLREVLGQPRSPRHDLGNERQKAGIGVKQREELHPGGKVRQELVEAAQRRIGMRSRPEYPQQLGYELGQDFARALAAGGAQSAVMPASHQRGHCGRLDKAELGESAQGFGIVIGAGENEIAWAGEGRGLLEKLRIMPLDRSEMSAQIGDEGLCLRIAQKQRDALDPGAVRRKPMSLRVVDHLQPVLEAAQETIVVNQLRGGRGIDPAGCREPPECLAGRADAQLLQSPAPDQLLRLGEELDLANAPAAGLDVVPFHRDPPAAAVRVDLALDRVDVLDGCEVEVFPPDEGLQLVQKSSSGGAVAGDRTGLDQRSAFPVLPDALIIGERRGNRHGERRRCRIRAEPKISAERIAVAGVGFENSHQLAREADKKGLYPVAHTDARRRRVIEDDQIDIARVS